MIDESKIEESYSLLDDAKGQLKDIMTIGLSNLDTMRLHNSIEFVTKAMKLLEI